MNAEPEMPRIGVLAIQGDYAAHADALVQSGAVPVEVRKHEELEDLDALIIPGGESTTMLKFLERGQLFDVLKTFCRSHPVFGTCAGAILLAREVRNPPQASLGLLDAVIERNAYGRQIDSRIAQIDVAGKPAEAVFIRAPIIRRVGPKAKVLAEYQGDPVMVEEGKHLVATFHPELSSNDWIHREFVARVAQ